MKRPSFAPRPDLQAIEPRLLPAGAPEPSPVPLQPVLPMGSLVYEGSTTASIDAAAETDSFTIDLDGGQTVTIIADPDGTLQPAVELVGPASASLGTASATAAAAPTASADLAGPQAAAATYGNVAPSTTPAIRPSFQESPRTKRTTRRRAISEGYAGSLIRGHRAAGGGSVFFDAPAIGPAGVTTDPTAPRTALDDPLVDIPAESQAELSLIL